MEEHLRPGIVCHTTAGVRSPEAFLVPDVELVNADAFGWSLVLVDLA